MHKKDYVFTSSRLGFRNWLPSDLDPLSDLNADPEVMRYFPSLKSRDETQSFISMMRSEFLQKGYCYFAVDLLQNSEFIGFIGLHEQTYPADFTPCTDMGWRLKKAAWNKGYATEGAKRCILHWFNIVGLNKIYATATSSNEPSFNVMRKAGMTFVKTFDHPKIDSKSALKRCMLYEINSADD